MTRPVLWGNPNGRTPLEVHELDLPLPGLGAPLAGLRLAVISDLHYGRFAGDGYARRIVREVMARRPDLICLLGDLVNGLARQCSRCAGILSELAAPLGVFGVLGNHEHYGGWRIAAEAYRQAGIEVLINEYRRIARGQAGLTLAGVDDHRQGRPSLAEALAGAGCAHPVIALSHNPDQAEHVPPDVRLDVMLSGHTHGGQVVLLNRPIITRTHYRQYWSGWAQGPRCRVYTNRGVGMVGLPLRLNCPPEIPIFRLVPLAP